MMTKAQRAKSNFINAQNNAHTPYETAIAAGLADLAEAVVGIEAQLQRVENNRR